MVESNDLQTGEEEFKEFLGEVFRLLGESALRTYREERALVEDIVHPHQDFH